MYHVEKIPLLFLFYFKIIIFFDSGNIGCIFLRSRALHLSE